MHLASIKLEDVTMDNVKQALTEAFRAVIANKQYGYSHAQQECQYRTPNGGCCVVGAMLTDEDTASLSDISMVSRELIQELGLDPPAALVNILASAQETHDNAAIRSFDTPPNKQQLVEAHQRVKQRALENPGHYQWDPLVEEVVNAL